MARAAWDTTPGWGRSQPEGMALAARHMVPMRPGLNLAQHREDRRADRKVTEAKHCIARRKDRGLAACQRVWYLPGAAAAQAWWARYLLSVARAVESIELARCYPRREEAARSVSSARRCLLEPAERHSCYKRPRLLVEAACN